MSAKGVGGLSAGRIPRLKWGGYLLVLVEREVSQPVMMMERYHTQLHSDMKVTGNGYSAHVVSYLSALCSTPVASHRIASPIGDSRRQSPGLVACAGYSHGRADAGTPNRSLIYPPVIQKNKARGTIEQIAKHLNRSLSHYELLQLPMRCTCHAVGLHLCRLAPGCWERVSAAYIVRT